MTTAKNNCFDVLRLVLAAAVIYGHSFPLGGFAPDPLAVATHGRMQLAPDAVLGFFGLSGYLIAASWSRSSSLLGFLRRRLLRIVPGFWACLVGTAFIIAPITERNHGSFPVREAFGFVWRNAGLHVRQTLIGSVSAGNLWSIWPEFTCYLGLAAFGLLGGISSRKILLVVALAGSVGIHLFFLAGASIPFLPPHLGVSLHQLAPYYLAFIVGVALHVWSDILILRRRGLALIFAGITILALFGGYTLASPILIPWFVVGLGESFRLRLRSDISYGTYLYGFAIQQLVISVPWFRANWLCFFVSGLISALAAGWLSWHLVERHFRIQAAT